MIPFKLKAILFATIFAIIFIFCNSCSIEKRVYQKGFFVQFKKAPLQLNKNVDLDTINVYNQTFDECSVYHTPISLPETKNKKHFIPNYPDTLFTNDVISTINFIDTLKITAISDTTFYIVQDYCPQYLKKYKRKLNILSLSILVTFIMALFFSFAFIYFIYLALVVINLYTNKNTIKSLL